MNTISSSNHNQFDPAGAQTQVISRPVNERIHKETIQLSAKKTSITVYIKLPKKLSIDVNVFSNCCLIIGRAPEPPENKIQYTLLALDSIQMSRTHLAIFKDNDALYAQDMGSTNGTYVTQNGVSQILEAFSPAMLGKDTFVEFGEAVLMIKAN